MSNKATIINTIITMNYDNILYLYNKCFTTVPLK